jgi:hypothetical protein
MRKLALALALATISMIGFASAPAAFAAETCAQELAADQVKIDKATDAKKKDAAMAEVIKAAARTDFQQCGESIIACAWPALALLVPDSIPSTPDTRTLTLYELMRAGRLDVAVGGIDHLEVIEKDNGDCVIVRRRV